MERIAVCIQQNGKEAILLTGETGVGKTSVVQMMALYSNNTLDVVNLSQDSDSTDLIGGYKPIGTLELLTPLIENVEKLIKASFDTEKNPKFISHFSMLLNEERFSDYLILTEATAKKAIETKSGDQLAWADILVRCQRLSKSLNSRKSALPFAYVEGIVSKAAKNGHWLLIDEINLLDTVIIKIYFLVIG
jgi:midasin